MGKCGWGRGWEGGGGARGWNIMIN